LPLKDPIKRKQYDKDYRQRPDVKIRVRKIQIRNKNKDHKRYENKKESIILTVKEYQRKIRQQLLNIIGDKCFICNSTSRICFHEIHGIPHKNCKPNFYLSHPQDFIPLCYYHHKLIHALNDLSPESREKVNKLLDSII